MPGNAADRKKFDRVRFGFYLGRGCSKIKGNEGRKKLGSESKKRGEDN
jgi:hypothetical protein